MSYTIKNLRDVQDAAPRFGYGERQEARFAGSDLNAEHTGLSLHLIKPDQRQAFAHRHHQAEEIYVVLRGEGQIKLDDELVSVQALDAIRVAPQVVRGFEAGPSGLEILAFGPHHQNDGELVREGFWPD